MSELKTRAKIWEYFSVILAASLLGFLGTTLLVLSNAFKRAQKLQQVYEQPQVMKKVEPAATAKSPFVNPPKEAPLFSLEDANRQSVFLEKLRGKTVILHFWASWCEPCKQEKPQLERFLKNTKEEKSFVFLAINEDKDRAAATAFFDSKLPNFKILFDRPSETSDFGEISKLYQVQGLPATVIIDKMGKIHFQNLGPIDWNSEELLTYLKSL